MAFRWGFERLVILGGHLRAGFLLTLLCSPWGFLSLPTLNNLCKGTSETTCQVPRRRNPRPPAIPTLQPPPSAPRTSPSWAGYPTLQDQGGQGRCPSQQTCLFLSSLLTISNKHTFSSLGLCSLMSRPQFLPAP